nr:SOS response-associated peptidase family protein [Halomonas socia]
MCGRFALYSDYPKLSASLKLPLAEPAEPLAPRYNVPPGTFITAVHRADDEAPLAMNELWWGYRPHWAGNRHAPGNCSSMMDSA